jgi:WD40 repeat protein
MSASDQVHPQTDSWVTAIHASEEDFHPLGGGVVLDTQRILTCAHVAASNAELWVAFPKAVDGTDDVRRRVERVVLAERPVVADLAILVLSEPVPPGVKAVPLRSPKPGDLAGQRWWAFGFPAGDPVGNSAHGSVGAALGYGWVRLDVNSRYHVEAGFSGGGLWSPDYQAVVAIVGQANDRGDARAITLYQAAMSFPDQYLRELTEQFSVAQSGDVALAAWGWSLSDDPEAARHWRPRARGVSIDSERGYRFRGRSAALQAINGWLDREQPDRRVLVVTGAPGSGKSAVLGRIVTTADADAVSRLPLSDTAIRATPGSVACAVHVKGKTALETAREIARAASAALPARIEDFAPNLREALADRAGRRFNVVVDALDESQEARLTIASVILPMAETCADVGAQVVIGSRPRDDDGDLLTAMGASQAIVDLDAPAFFIEGDLASYAQATLQLAGDERDGNPYADDSVAILVASRIGELAESNFLVAGLIARAHGLYDESAIDPSRLSFTPTVEAAMEEYLRHAPSAAGVSAETLLTALAFADAPGIPASLWRESVRALGYGEISETALARFTRSSAANFLVESSDPDNEGMVFRLFHQALNDTLLSARALMADRRTDESSLSSAFAAFGRRTGWNRAPTYLFRSLPSHSARAGKIDHLLADDAYLLHADLAALLPVLDYAKTSTARLIAAIYRDCIENIRDARPEARRWALAMSAARFGARDITRRLRPVAPPLGLWPRWSTGSPHPALHATLAGHLGYLRAVACTEINNRPVALTGSGDATARIWDLSTGRQIGAPLRHSDALWAVACTTLGDLPVAVTVDGTWRLHVWDLHGGEQIRRAERTANTNFTDVVTCIMVNGRPAAITGGGQHGGMEFWDITRDPLVGEPFEKASGWIGAIASTTLEGRSVVVSGDHSGTVTVWDPVSREVIGEQMRSDLGRAESISCGTMDGRPVAVVLYYDESGEEPVIGVWDLITRREMSTRYHEGVIHDFACVTVKDRLVAITGDYDDGMVHQWDLGRDRHVGTPFKGNSQGIISLSSMLLENRPAIVTCGHDGVAQVWDLSRQQPAGHPVSGHARDVRIIECAIVNGEPAAISASLDGTVRIWNIATGRQAGALTADRNAWRKLACVTTQNGRAIALTSTSDHNADVWDLATRVKIGSIRPDQGGIDAMIATVHRGKPIAVVAGGAALNVWDLEGCEIVDVVPVDDMVRELTCIAAPDGQPIVIGAGQKGVWRWELGGRRQGIRPVGGPFAPWYFTGLAGTFLNGRPSVVAIGNVKSDSDSRSDLLIGEIHVWDLISGAMVGRHRTTVGDLIQAVTCTTLNNTPVAVTGGNDRWLRIWDLAANKLKRKMPMPGQIESIACGPDGSLVIGVGSDVVVLDADGEASRPSEHGSRVEGAARPMRFC